jgi:ABC-type sulfate/molybdate transport systems ATPase subunit
VADRVVVFNRGRVEQEGPPGEVYGRPATPFVADFIGSGVRLPARTQGTIARIGPCTVAVPDQGPRERDAVAYVRPHQLRLSPDPRAGIAATVARVHASGALTRIELVLPGLGLRCEAHQAGMLDLPVPSPGQTVSLRPMAAVVFPVDVVAATHPESAVVAAARTNACPGG